MKSHYFSRFIAMLFLWLMWGGFTIAGAYQGDLFIIISGIIITLLASWGVIRAFKEWRDYYE